MSRIKHINQKLTFLAIGLFSFALIATGCKFTPNETDLALIGTKINQVKTESKLKALIADSQKSLNYDMATPEVGGSAPTNAETDGGSATRDYVDTNVQVEGVDEGDIVKTDGYQIFYAPRYENTIRVFDVDDDHVISLNQTLDLGKLYTDAIYLLDDYLVVVGYSYEENETSCGIYTDGEENYCVMRMWYAPTGTVMVIDRTTLEPVYLLKTDSYFMDHRVIDRSLFLVSHKYLYEEQLVPMFNETTDAGTESSELDYDDIYYFDETPVYGMTVLTGLYLDEVVEDIHFNASAYLGATSWYKQLYVSLNALYISETSWIYEENRHYTQMTISQFDLDVDEAQMTYVAATIVEGGALNQFSMDEYQGYFRVATTNNAGSWTITSQWFWNDYKRTVTNHLYVLKVNRAEANFDLIGHLSEGLGKPDESIQSVRFLQNKAYIVTFLRTDPLYIIDLSDPEEPTITDEIHLPGYDTYQHPWGENYLLGLGYQADDNGSVTGIKLTAYETSTGSSSALQTYELLAYETSNDGENEWSWSYGYSEALWNHKALLVSVKDGLFGFPVYAYEYGYSMTSEEVVSSDREVGYYSWYWTYHSYYYLFDIDFTRAEPISEPTIIEHPDNNQYYVGVDRAVMIDGYVYTISNQQVITYNTVDQMVVNPPLVLA